MAIKLITGERKYLYYIYTTYNIDSKEEHTGLPIGWE